MSSDSQIIWQQETTAGYHGTDELFLHIYHGKACCHLEFEDRWAWVKRESIDKYLTNHLNAFQYELFLSGKRFHHLDCLNKYV